MEKVKGELDFSGVEETALLTLYAKAVESLSEEPILKDEKAEEMTARLDPILSKRTGKMANQLYSRDLDPRLTTHIPLRALKYDTYTREFLAINPKGVVVNIGCGMDARFFRIDNGKVRFFDLDLPNMIKFKRQLLDENARYKMIAQSVLDFSWMDKIEKIKEPKLFLAEGVLMYLPERDVRKLVLELQRRFPASDFICELVNKSWTEGFWGKIAARKMKMRLHMNEDASFHFGVNDARELESWNNGIEFKEKWFYMDDNHPKLGWLRIFRNWKVFNNGQYTARYHFKAK